MFHKKALTGWMIALINLCAISSIKNFPLLAEYGLSIVPFLALTAIFFFIPAALVSAELASGWPAHGVYTWVRKAMGPRMGFFAIWLQWVNNVAWYPTILSFIAGSFAYIFNPELIQNKTYVIAVILITFWAMTFVNFLGMRVSGWISSLSALFGTIIPIVLIITLGAIWVAEGRPSQIAFSWKGLLPDLTSIRQLVLLSGVLLGVSGIEMSAVHAKDVANPKKEYPKGIFLSAVLILLFATLGALTLAVVLPVHEISLTSGSMEAFRLLFHAFGVPWAMPVIAAMATFGALGMMSTWIAGPSRGLYATTEQGDLPPIFHKENRHGMPTHILIAQGLIVTLLSIVFLLMPSVNSSYWVLVALASILYMIMYVLMFISALLLRYKEPHTPRVYRVPYGKPGLWIVCLLGSLGASFGIFISFFPPSQIDTGAFITLETILIAGTALFCLLPFYIFSRRKPHWRK